MFGLNTMIRSVATGVAASVDSTSRTVVGGLAILEQATANRLDAFAVKARKEQYELELTKDLEETARSLGHKDLASAISHKEAIKALIMK